MGRNAGARNRWQPTDGITRPPKAVYRWLVPGQLLLIVDDVNGGLLGGGRASVDTDVISHQVCVYVFAKPLVRRNKSTCSRVYHLISLRKFGLPLSFVGSLLLGVGTRSRHAIVGVCFLGRKAPCARRRYLMGL